MISLITGATGFIGSAVARRLIEARHRVRVLMRANSPRNNLAGIECEIVIGDLNDYASVARAVAGCDAVFHLAADYRLWAPSPDEIYRTNVEGSAKLVIAAVEARVHRIVYCSSVATLGILPKGLLADERTASSLEDMHGHYKRSKYLAEQRIMELTELGAPVIIVNPAAPIGPRDIKPTPTGRFVLQAALGRMPAYINTGLNVVHVDDVAEGHLLAFERGRVGERYILGGQNLSLHAILDCVARESGRAPPRIRLPRRPLFPVAYAMEAWARHVSSKEPMLTVDSLRMAGKHMHFSCDKARDTLGFSFRPAEDAIHDAVGWFRDKGYLH
jgi:dihydroflavonol-4-reductase